MRPFGNIFTVLAQMVGAASDARTQRRFGRELAAIGGVGREGPTDAYVLRRDVVVRGHVVPFAADESIAELWAVVTVPSGLVFATSRHWGERTHPSIPIRTPGGDLAEPIARALDGEHPILLVCNGPKVACQFELGLARKTLDAIVDAVVAVAKFDNGLTADLHGLPGVVPLIGHELDPGVSFAEDGLVLGVRKGEHTVAQLDGFPATRAKATIRDGKLEGDGVPAATRALLEQAGDGDLLVTSSAARFTWNGVEREPDALLAGVRALRSLRPATGPYR